MKHCEYVFVCFGLISFSKHVFYYFRFKIKTATDPEKNLKKMNELKPGWFSELEPGHSFSLECESVLYKSKSKYQDILVFNKYRCIIYIYIHTKI